MLSFGTWVTLLLALNMTAVQAKMAEIQVHEHVKANAEAEPVVTHKTPPALFQDQSDASAKSLVRKESPQGKKNATGQKIDIDVYYETRCPGCLLFLNKTLEPLWRNTTRRELFNVNLYTYGNGMTVDLQNISDGYKFWHPESTAAGWNTVQICQHGSDECLGNLVQVCAKDVATPEQHMELVFCMTGTTIDGYGVEKASYECMLQAGVDKDKVRDCVTSPNGNQLMTAAGATTNKLKGRRGTPWVMVGSRHVADAVLTDHQLLFQSVCSIANNAPGQCAEFNVPAAAAAADPAPAPTTPDFTVLDNDQDELLKVSSV